MILYLIRHGKAHPSTETNPDDLRPLTEDGKIELLKIAKVWREMGIVFDKILTSPIFRAKETAKIIAEVYEWTGSIEESNVLGHEFHVEGVIAKLKTLKGKKKIALVAHNPDLGILASAFLGCDASPCVDFEKNAIMGIKFAGVPASGTGSLQFYLPPNFLRRFFEE